MNLPLRFIKESFTYLVANIINAAIPFLLLPFLTTHLSPADYGLLALFQVLTTAVTPFIGLNFDSTLGRYYFDYNQQSLRKLLSNGIVITIVSAVVIALIFFSFSLTISKISEFPNGWLWSVVLFSFLQKVIEIPLALWRVQRHPLKYATLRVLRTLFDIGLSVAIILIWNLGWEGRMAGQLIAVFIFGGYSLFYLIKLSSWRLSWNRKEMFKIFQFGLPLIPHELGAFIIAFSDRLFISHMVGMEATGIYSVGYQIGLVIGLLQNSFNQAWVPWFYSKLEEGKIETKLNIVRITYVYNLAMLALVFALFLLKPFIFLLLGKNFVNAGQFILWIALGFAFNGMYKMVVNYLFFVKKTYLIGGLTIFTAALNIILNYLLINKYGAIGAAYATAMALFIQFLITWIICVRVYDMPWLLKTS